MRDYAWKMTAEKYPEELAARLLYIRQVLVTERRISEYFMQLGIDSMRNLFSLFLEHVHINGAPSFYLIIATVVTNSSNRIPDNSDSYKLEWKSPFEKTAAANRVYETFKFSDPVAPYVDRDAVMKALLAGEI